MNKEIHDFLLSLFLGDEDGWVDFGLTSRVPQTLTEDEEAVEWLYGYIPKNDRRSQIFLLRCSNLSG